MVKSGLSGAAALRGLGAAMVPVVQKAQGNARIGCVPSRGDGQRWFSAASDHAGGSVGFFVMKGR